MRTVERFRGWLRRDGKAEKTIESYATDAEAFQEWLGKQLAGPRFGRGDIVSYRQHLLDSGYGIATINKKINSLRSLNEHLVEAKGMERMVVDPSKDRVSIARGSGEAVDVFSEDEVRRILDHVESGKVSDRDVMTVHLLLYTGIRVGELVGLRLRDIDLLAGELRVIGKGGKYREIPLNGRAVESVRRYLRGERRESRFVHSEHLLLTERSPRAHRDTVNGILRGIGRDLGMRMYPHKFRHTCFTMLVRRGADIATVCELAGHASIDTTHRYYLNTSREDKARAVELL